MAMNRIQFQHGMSMPEFLKLYGTEALCATALERARWPDGFRCPGCGGGAQCILHTDDALTRSGCAAIYEETASGKSSSRIELEHCRKALHAGDTLMVWRLDRLGRSLSDLMKIISDLEREGFTFESLSEKINTGSASGKLQFHVFAALAEFERNLIRERTMAGLPAARARGRVGGRKPKLSEKQIREIKSLLTDPASQVNDIAKRYGVSRTTLYKRVGAVNPVKVTVSI